MMLLCAVPIPNTRSRSLEPILFGKPRIFFSPAEMPNNSSTRMKIKDGAVHDKDLGGTSVGIQALPAARNTHDNADYHFSKIRSKHGSRSNTSMYKN